MPTPTSVGNRRRRAGAVLAAALLTGTTGYALLTSIGPSRITDPDTASSALRETPTPSVAPPTPTTGAAGPSVGARPATLPEVRTPVPPTRIVVPGIDAELPVVPTAVRADGAMEIPDDPRTAGWYRFGPDPTSDSGAMVVAAHIDSRELVGPLARLSGLSPGDEVLVSTADQEVRYVIERVDSYPKKVIDLDAVFDRGGAPRLHLITCGGRWDPVARSYEDNVVAVGVRVDVP